MRFALLLAAGFLATPICYGQYRCVENGKTLLTDRPCASSPATPEPKVTNTFGDAKSSAYSTTVGAWRGQVQFMAKSGADVVNEAHAVAPIVVEIDTQGKVTGSSTETGCAFKGIAKPGVLETTELDVSFSNCRYAGYNRQMAGRLILNTAKSYVDFNLFAFDMIKRPVGYFEIKGTLRR